MNNIVDNTFEQKNGATQYTHIKVGRNKSYFTNDPLNGNNKYAASDIRKMIEFLVDKIYVRFGRQLAFLWEQTVPHYWLICSYGNEFLDKFIKESKRKLLESSSSDIVILMTFSLSITKRSNEFTSNINLKELTISETTESSSVASYFDLLFMRDENNNITTKLYHK